MMMGAQYTHNVEWFNQDTQMVFCVGSMINLVVLIRINACN